MTFGVLALFVLLALPGLSTAWLCGKTVLGKPSEEIARAFFWAKLKVGANLFLFILLAAFLSIFAGTTGRPSAVTHAFIELTIRSGAMFAYCAAAMVLWVTGRGIKREMPGSDVGRQRLQRSILVAPLPFILLACLTGWYFFIRQGS